MSRLADPSICPDCRAPLESRRCTGCGLELVGTPAATLWEHMLAADQLVEQLRVASGRSPAAIPAPPAPTAPPVGTVLAPGSLPAYPVPPTVPSRQQHPVNVRASSVPVVLLALGATCLLVAAIVFVTVSWSSLGLGAKATILVLVTALFGAAAMVVTRRGLRGGAEALWLVVLTMLSIDLLSAHAAGLAGFDNVPDRQAIALLGALLLLASLKIRLWAASTPVPALFVPVGGTLVGTVLLTASEAWDSDHPLVGAAISVPLIVAVSVLLARHSALRSAALAMALVAGFTWLGLVAGGLDRAAGPTHHAWWHHVSGWPLVIAAVYAAATSVVRTLNIPLRQVAAGSSLGIAALFLLGPVAEDDVSLLTACGIAVVIALVAASPFRVWRGPAAVLTGLGLAAGTAMLLVRPLVALATIVPAHGLALDARLRTPDSTISAWTAIAVAAAVVVAGGALLGHVAAERRSAVTLSWVRVTPVALAIGGATVLLESHPTLAVAALTWAVVLAVATVCAVLAREHDDVLVGLAVLLGYLAGVAAWTASPSHLASAILASAIALVAAFGYLRAAPKALHGAVLPLLAVVLTGSAAYAAAQWCGQAGAGRTTTAFTLVALTAALGLAAAPASRTPLSRIVLEGAALVLGLAAVAVPAGATDVAVALTVLGSAVALVSLLHRDRDQVSWLAATLLAIATGIRINEDVTAPEVVALPAAALLLAVGIHRLRAEHDLGTFRALASGLSLALAPSLLLSLDDPVSWRGTAVFVAGLVVLAVGVRLRWAAPFVAGAAVVGVLAVRQLGPVAEALPRWISLGTIGVVLLLVGITWEARRQNVETASRYLTALR